MWDAFYPPMDWDANQASWPNAHFSRFVQLPGQTWHVQITGTGPPLLLLHGTGASTHSFRELLLPLAVRHTVVCPDLTGHAFTSMHRTQTSSLNHISANLQALLDHLQLWPQAIVGHSAGAAIGAQLILQQPQRPTPVLIGLNPAWFPLRGVAQWLFPPTATLLALNPLSARLFSRFGSDARVVRALLESTGSKLDARAQTYYQRLLQAPSHVRGVLSMMTAWRLEALERDLSRLKGPVFIHLGANDRTVAPEQAEQACALMPQAVKLVCSGLGHLAHEEAPRRTSAQILAWIAQARA
ncbi:MAG: alpha/beta fold hydrolase [Rhodoferax sp.]|nr:alpha/beta fold hydrolase [Rhodoferax sp.]